MHLQQLRKLCPHIKFLHLGGKDPASEEQKYAALAAADLALSLSITCKKHLASLLLRQWLQDYRLSLQIGMVTGILSATESMVFLSLPIGLHARRVHHRIWVGCISSVSSYPAFAGSLAQLVQVDMEAAASAIRLLLQDPLLRRRMGEAAAKRAHERFQVRSSISLTKTCSIV